MSVKVLPKIWLKFQIIFVFLVLGLAFSSSTPPQAVVPSASYLKALPELRIGDLVLRQGPDIESLLILEASKGRYSHVGLVIQTSPTIKIIHATTNDDPNHPNQVIITPINEFLAPKFSRTFMILRPSFMSQQMRSDIVKDSMSYLGKPFRLTSKDQDPFYCTTYILDVIQKQYPNFSLTWARLDLPVFHGEYLFPEAFLVHPQLQQVYVQN